MTLSIKSRRSLGWTGWMAAVAAAAMAGLVASGAVAQATVTLSPVGPYANGARVTVTGNQGALRTVTHYSVAQCNLSATPGTRCNQGTASTLLPIATLSRAGYVITLANRFTDYDFTTMTRPGTSTICRGRTGDQCGIVVSFYDSSGGPPVQLGASTTNISFR